MYKGKKRILFVVQRYGKGVIGGAEMLCREYAQKLKEEYEVSVLTTCAKDYNTWENYYAPGVRMDEGVRVRRFKTLRPRDGLKLLSLTEQVYNNPYHDYQTAAAWLQEVGPYAPELVKYLRAHKDDYDAFLFVGYHYYTTTACLPLVPERAIFIPTAHDEEPLRKCNYFRYLFNMPKAMLFLTAQEKEFVQAFFNNGRIPSVVCGSGVEAQKVRPLEEELIFKYALYSPYVIYTGRIDNTKNCGQLIEYFTEYKNKTNVDLKLLLVGQANMEIPVRTDITVAGYVSEYDKMQLVGNARAFIMPSENESLSISTLEAMAMGVPVIACGRSPVMKNHVEVSGGGFCYAGTQQFSGTLDVILSDRQAALEMGRAGKAYAEKNYNWDDVLKKLKRVIDGVAQGTLHLKDYLIET